jgi:shikimate kinase
MVMSTPNNIFLVGPMGAGKSTVGRQLGKSLKKQFIDCDKEIENRTGASISLIFDVEGESGFRKREQQILDELTERNDLVLATGGGAVLDELNRSRLMSRGFVVYLNAPLDLLIERTSRDKTRPLLQTENPKQRISELLEQRDPLYRQVADTIVETNRRSARHVVKEIQERLDNL